MANLVMDGVTLASKSGSDITIQNTNVNFPAGHIIQTIVAKKTDENSASMSSSSLTKVVDSSGNAEWRATINNVSSGNDIIVSASFTIRVGHTQDQHGISMGFKRDTGTPSNSGGTDVYESTSTGIVVRSENPPNFPFTMTLQEIKR